MKLLALLCAAVLVTACAAFAVTPQGGLTVQQQMDATVALIDPLTREVNCTGVVKEKNRVLTAKHCVNPVADDVPLRFRDGREALGKVIMRADGIDIALVEVDTGNAPIARSALNEFEGDKVCAVGMPMGFFEWSYTCGVISALRYNLYKDFADVYGDHPWIQTDTPITGGNSGGPLFDVDGRLVGIVAWGIKFQYANSISFAVPVWVALKSVGL
jgi:serine protease Do